METENNNEEVKDFVDTVKIDPSKDDELVDEDESETHEDSSTQENDTDDNPDEEDEDESEESEEDTEDEDEDSTEEDEDHQEEETKKDEPKPVEGETPRERALRLETTRLKALLRKERQDELFVSKKSKKDDSDDELSGYDPDELKRFEQIATKMGFAKKDEIASDKNNSEFDSFLEAHPEYLPENDSDGVLWDQFKSEFNLYVAPSDPKSLKKVLNKVHKEIFGTQPQKNLNKINASREKIKVASHTGASAEKTPKVKKSVNHDLRIDAMKGFTDEEKEELFS